MGFKGDDEQVPPSADSGQSAFKQVCGRVLGGPVGILQHLSAQLKPENLRLKGLWTFGIHFV